MSNIVRETMKLEQLEPNREDLMSYCSPSHSPNKSLEKVNANFLDNNFQDYCKNLDPLKETTSLFGSNK